MLGFVTKLFLVFVIIALPLSLVAQERVDWKARDAGRSTQTNFTASGLSSAGVESFEGSPFPPEGWKKITNFGGSGWQQIAVGSEVPGFQSNVPLVVDGAPGGGGAVAMASWVTGDADSLLSTGQQTDQWLITPQIQNVQDGDSLKFYLKYFLKFGDNLDILISTTVADSVDSFNVVVTSLNFDNGSSNDWIKHSFALTDFVDPGSNIYIAFRERVNDTENEGDALFLDLVEVPNLVTGVAEEPTLPIKFELSQNYPNPFNPSTQITFSLPQSAEVNLTIHNLLGHVVATLIDREHYSSGSHTIRFDASHLPNGVYFYKIEAGDLNLQAVKKMTLLK